MMLAERLDQDVQGGFIPTPRAGVSALPPTSRSARRIPHGVEEDLLVRTEEHHAFMLAEDPGAFMGR
jgi:hypothetical protein